MNLYIDIRWLLDTQERLLGKELQVLDYSAFVAAVARHRVNTPHLDVGEPDAFWRAAALLDTIVLQRPLPARNEAYGYAVAAAYLDASGEILAPTAPEERIQLIKDIRALRLTTYDIADRLRSWRVPAL